MLVKSLGNTSLNHLNKFDNKIHHSDNFISKINRFVVDFFSSTKNFFLRLLGFLHQDKKSQLLDRKVSVIKNGSKSIDLSADKKLYKVITISIDKKDFKKLKELLTKVDQIKDYSVLISLNDFIKNKNVPKELRDLIEAKLKKLSKSGQKNIYLDNSNKTSKKVWKIAIAAFALSFAIGFGFGLHKYFGSSPKLMTKEPDSTNIQLDDSYFNLGGPIYKKPREEILDCDDICTNGWNPKCNCGSDNEVYPTKTPDGKDLPCVPFDTKPSEVEDDNNYVSPQVLNYNPATRNINGTFVSSNSSDVGESKTPKLPYSPVKETRTKDPKYICLTRLLQCSSNTTAEADPRAGVYSILTGGMASILNTGCEIVLKGIGGALTIISGRSTQAAEEAAHTSKVTGGLFKPRHP